MKRTLQIAVIVLVLAGSAGARGGVDPRPGRGGKLAWMEEQLGLPNEKAKAVRTVFERSRKEAAPMRDLLKVATSKLRWQLDAKAGVKDISATLDEIEKAREELRKRGEKARSEIDAILTPEQRASLLLAHERGPGGRRRFPPIPGVFPGRRSEMSGGPDGMPARGPGKRGRLRRECAPRGGDQSVESEDARDD